MLLVCCREYKCSWFVVESISVAESISAAGLLLRAGISVAESMYKCC